ncbi:MAG: hypothetical protein SGPRY_003624, partial [Prymnesium sp.]
PEGCAFAHSAVAVIASCSDMRPPPSWTSLMLHRQAASLAPPSFSLALLIDDTDCPSRCEELRASPGLSSLRCLATSQNSFIDRSELAIWRRNKPPNTLNRPDVVHFLSLDEHACASSFWVVEPDVAFFGDWGSLLRRYNDALDDVDLLASTKPYLDSIDYVNPLWNHSGECAPYACMRRALLPSDARGGGEQIVARKASEHTASRSPLVCDISIAYECLSFLKSPIAKPQTSPHLKMSIRHATSSIQCARFPQVHAHSLQFIAFMCAQTHGRHCKKWGITAKPTRRFCSLPASALAWCAL